MAVCLAVMYVCMYAYIMYVCMYACMHARTYARTYVHVNTYAIMYRYVRVYMNVCIYYVRILIFFIYLFINQSTPIFTKFFGNMQLLMCLLVSPAPTCSG